MTQMTISITDASCLPLIRRVIRALPGVGRIKVTGAIEEHEPNKTTIEAIEAADRGELRSFDSLEAFSEYVRNV